MTDVMDSARSFELENPTGRGPTGSQLEGVLAAAGIVLPDAAPAPSTPPAGGAPGSYVNPDGSVNEKAVYDSLAELIAEGNKVVSQLSFVDPNAEGTLSGMASVLAAVRQMIKDFASVHSDYVRHRQRIEMEKVREDSKLRIEQVRQQMKLQMMERKHQMDLEKIEAARRLSGEQVPQGAVGYSQADIARALMEARNDAGSDS